MQGNDNISAIRQEISDEEVASFTNAIKMKYGIDFTNYETKSLKRGIARLIARNNLTSLLDLWSKVLRDRDFMYKCIDDLTVNLTELFRNPEVWSFLEVNLKNLFPQKNGINIWHSGCSTGEEIYSMAVVLENAGLLNFSKALATDLSTVVLAEAKTGVFQSLYQKKYRESFLKYKPTGKFENHFIVTDENLKVKDHLTKHVSFLIHNLVQDPPPGKFDLIFCRNVMIYFDDKLKDRVMNLFYQSLNPGGYFIIGYYDMLNEDYKKYFELVNPTFRIYQRK